MASSLGSSQLPFFAAPCQDMGIDAIRLVTDQIGAEVHTLVNMPPARTGQYADLLQSLYVGFGQGLAIIAGLINAAAPINCIPPELLTNIFALSPTRAHSHNDRAQGSELPYWPFEEPNVDDLHKLPKVYRYWRDVAIATPTLWTSVVTHHTREHNIYLRHSIYLPEDPSLGFVVHFNPRGNLKNSTAGMTKFMLTNAPKIREFHAWDSSTIQDLPSFLAAFDASALEHCTIRDTVRRYPRLPFPGSRSLPLFSGGGDRLRSLCLTDIHDLPGKAFPALTLLLIAFINTDIVVRWNMEDLLTLLAGSARLEEVYVHNMWFSLNNLPPRSAGFAQISLPRLRHLAFTYRPESGHAEAINPPDYLLTRISCIPSTCHMTFTAAGSGGSESTKRAIDILDSVRRRVHGKDAVSHAFLRLFAGSTTMQLVFSQGSLRLHLPAPAGAPARPGTLKPLDVFAVFADLFSRTEELRVHYNDDSVASALSASLPAACPHLRTMSLIWDFDWDRQWPAGPPDAQPTLHAAFKHLAPPLALARGAGAGVGAVDGTIPYPALDTLWVSLERPDEIAQLEADLAARASLGFPVNCVIVTIHARGAGRPDLGVTVARLRVLNAGKVIVMEIGEGTAGGSSALREVDWMVRLPERFALPPAVHRDWPVGWHDRKY